MELVNKMMNIMQEHYQEVFGLPDWELHEAPKMLLEEWQKFIEIVGEENVKIVSGSFMQRGPNET